ncbi:MAG: hypothetical protein HOQ22_03775 [Nocardioidaceae bacterium]|nr:hypothetical protein [Nocardioidaceae bacterium]NUS50147.1 hypothetical protein [Nocardioidaceae bacterium]
MATLTPEPEAATEPEAEPQPESPAPPEPQRPAKHPRLEAIVVGLLVGAVGAGLFYASLQGCDVVRGTESCGGGPGLLLVVVILGLMVLLGAVLLTARAVAEPRSTSFLGVGLLCVVLMVAALQQVFSSWMFLVVPLVSAAAYLIAHWVTTTYVEPQPEKGPEHDVR